MQAAVLGSSYSLSGIKSASFHLKKMQEKVESETFFFFFFNFILFLNFT